MEIALQSEVDYSGSTIKENDGKITCEFNTSEPQTKQRFTIAHETWAFGFKTH